MTAIERTAYPRLLPGRYRSTDLRLYQPTIEEMGYLAKQNIRTDKLKLNFMLQLKTFQQIHYFMPVESIPKPIVHYIANQLELPLSLKPRYDYSDTKSRHCALIRRYCKINVDKATRDQLIDDAAMQSAQTLNDPAEMINVVIQSLVDHHYELPAYYKLDKTISRIRTQTNQSIFASITSRLRNARKLTVLFNTLNKEDAIQHTAYHRFKSLPQKATVTNFKLLLEHHEFLIRFGDMRSYLKDISHIKLAQFAEEARSLSAYHIKSMQNKDKRYGLIACLLAEAQAACKDALAKTCKTSIYASEKEAKHQYTGNQKQRDELMVEVVDFILSVTTGYQRKKFTQKKLADFLKLSYENYGGPTKVIDDCEKLLAKPSSKHYPYMWKPYRSNRKNIFSFISNLKLDAITSKQNLLESISLCKTLYESKYQDDWYRPHSDLDLSFIPSIWEPLIFDKSGKKLDMRYFELCCVLQLCEELTNGDIYINGADEYSDYRSALLSPAACKPLLSNFCKAANIPRTGKQAVNQLRRELVDKIYQVDQNFPKLKEFIIDHNGVPTLKKRYKKLNHYALKLLKEVKLRMPERNLLDVLCLGHHNTQWGNAFSLLSGSDAKLTDAIEAYITTAFCYGTAMGPAETERHVKSGISARTISMVNKSHVSLKKLNRAMQRVIDYYKGFPLIQSWGSGEAASGDGTLINIFDQNLLSEMHFRYGKRGGIAYHHISDTYIALFSSLIPCGVWEAIAILDGLLKNDSSIKPKRFHGDTQAQSTTVFGLSYLFGIQLMPRIRQWKDLIFYTPERRMRLKNIGSLFKGDTINWQLIEDNWHELLRTAISIQQGKISSRLILSRLNSKNKGSVLYKAFNELGKVIRTQFLLDYVSDVELREQITAETNKVESFNNLSDWIAFGSRFMAATNDTVQMEKAIKYNTLIANLVMLQNVIDISRIIKQLKKENWMISPEDTAILSPYLTGHLKRFGDFVLNLLLTDGNIEQIRQDTLFENAYPANLTV